jgi:hypothetical protein
MCIILPCVMGLDGVVLPFPLPIKEWTVNMPTLETKLSNELCSSIFETISKIIEQLCSSILEIISKN